MYVYSRLASEHITAASSNELKKKARRLAEGDLARRPQARHIPARGPNQGRAPSLRRHVSSQVKSLQYPPTGDRLSVLASSEQ
eukprot:scaffold29089_cov102-Isochrysis_galbana.AAC.1